MYDALYEMMGFDRVGRLIERHVIEVAPLAFMRGRTLNESFVILDEAQNTTIEQMKMFLTRIGFGSRAVVTGDITQTDLPKGRESGLKQAIACCEGVDGISFVHFTPKDVVRHPLVQTIVAAYAKEDEEGAHGRTRQ
jgi:phosphate starvation-inducible protein PhoH and related proteins